MSRCSGLLLLFCCLPFPLVAQNAPAIPKAAETIEVSIVNIEAVVTDRHGARVRGLKRDDFEVFEDGVRQPITNFTEYAGQPSAETETRIAPAHAAGAPPAAPQRRTVIVFVERFYLPHFSADPFFAAMKKLLRDTIRPGDRAMIVTWNSGAMSMRQGFTDDLHAIDAAVDAVAARTVMPMADERDEILTEIQQADAFAREAGAFNSERGAQRGVDFGATMGEMVQKGAARERARMALRDEKQKVQTLTALIRSVAADDGKKVLLLAAHRLSHYAGLEYFAVGAMQLEERDRNDFDARPLTKALAAAANANGVTIYPLYAEGIPTRFNVDAGFRNAGTQPTGAENNILLNETTELLTVAETTGGTTAWSPRDVTNLLPRVTDDFDSYYSLAYRAPKQTAGTAHKVVVKTKDPSLQVRARREYSLKSDATRMEDRVVATLFGTQPPSAFDIALKVGKATADKGGFTVPLSIEIPIASLTPLPESNDSYAGTFSVYTAWGATLGGISDVTHQTQSYRIAARDLAQAKKSHYTYELPLHVRGIGERIAIGVVDETSKEFALRLLDLPPLRK